MKRLVAMTLALLLVLSLAGCGEDKPATDHAVTSGEATKEETTAAPSSEQTAPSSEESSAEPATESESAPAESTAELPTEPEPVPAERAECSARILEGSVFDEKTGVMYYLGLPAYLVPADFAVISENDILILDSVFHRLQRYKDGAYSETVKLPDQEWQKLCVIGENAYVVANGILLKIDLNTKEQSEISLPASSQDSAYYVQSLCEEEGTLYLVLSGHGTYFLNEETQEVEKVASQNEPYSANRVGGIDGKEIRVKKGNRSWTIPAPNCFGDVIGFGEDGILYFCLYDLNLTPEDEGYCRILKCAAGEGVVAESFVDISKRVYSEMLHNCEKVGADGNVYVLGLYEEKFIVYKLEVGAEDIREPEIPSPHNDWIWDVAPLHALSFTADYLADGKEYSCRFNVYWSIPHIQGGRESAPVWRGATYTLEGSGPIYEKLRESVPEESKLWYMPGDESGRHYLTEAASYAEDLEQLPYIELEKHEYDPRKSIYSQWEDLEFVLKSPAAEGVSLVFKPSAEKVKVPCSTTILQGLLNDETSGIIYYWYKAHCGPKDFAVISDNDILILEVDAAHRIQHFKNGKFFETISLPEGQEYSRICVIGETIYVLKADGLLKIDLNTKAQSEISFASLKIPGQEYLGSDAVDMLESDGKLYFMSRNHGSFCLNEETGKIERAASAKPYIFNQDLMQVTNGELRWELEKTPGVSGGVIGFGEDGVLYCYLINFDWLEPEDEGYCRIVKCTSGEGIVAESFVDTSPWRYLPRTFAKAGPDGNVYVLGLYEERFIVFKLNVGAEDITADPGRLP